MKTNTELKIAAISFIVMGLLLLLSGIILAIILDFLPKDTLNIVRYSYLAKVIYPYITVAIIVSFLYLYEGAVLWQKKFTNSNFWFGVFLSFMYLPLFPVGTIIGTASLILMFRNLKYFK